MGVRVSRRNNKKKRRLEVKLHASFLLALNACLASGLVVAVSSGFATPAYADTFSPFTVVSCPDGGVPIFSGDDYSCGDPGGLERAGSGPHRGPAGGPGSSGSSDGIKVSVKASGSCHNTEAAIADQAANVAFMAYWETNLKPRVAPNHKNYVVTFSDGSRDTYNWNNVIGDVAIEETDTVCSG